jgi:hypothetical protein
VRNEELACWGDDVVDDPPSRVPTLQQSGGGLGGKSSSARLPETRLALSLFRTTRRRQALAKGT